MTWDNVTGKPSIYQSTLFLHSTAADVATYKTALTVPSAAATANVTAVCNSAGGEVLLAAFITAPMGVSVINGNAWSFKTFGKVDSGNGRNEHCGAGVQAGHGRRGDAAVHRPERGG